MKFRSLFGIFLLSFLPTAQAGEATSQPIDVSMAGMSRANLDSFESIRYASSTLALLSRYQIGVGADLKSGLDWQAEAAALDSNTGPVALGLLFQYSSGEEVIAGDALPGWRLPEDDLIEDQTDVLFGAGAAA